MSAGSLRERVAAAMPCEWCGAAARTPCVEWDKPIEGFHEGTWYAAGRLANTDAVLAEVRAWLGSVDAIAVAADEMEHKDWCAPIQRGCTCRGARNREALTILAALTDQTKEAP